MPSANECTLWIVLSLTVLLSSHACANAVRRPKPLTLDQLIARTRESPNALSARTSLVHFVHIPKTGGSTFGTAIKRYMGAHYNHSAYIEAKSDPNQVEGCSPLTNNSAPCARSLSEASPQCPFLIGCVLSHTPRLNFLKDKRAVSITFLRQPVGRTVSAYAHGWPHTPSSTRGCGKNLKLAYCLPIDAYVENQAYRNVAVRVLGNDSWPYSHEHVEQLHFSMAIERLHMFDFVGLSEVFYTSTKLAFEILGWRLKQWTVSQLIETPTSTECRGGQHNWCHDMAAPNIAPGYFKIRDRVLRNVSLTQRIKDLNRYDVLLWDAAAAMFCAKLKKHRDTVFDDDPVVQAEVRKAGLCTDEGFS